MTTKVEKRDGTIVDFDKTKIENALAKAFESTEKGLDKDLVSHIATEIELEILDKHETIAVECVQNMCEEKLMSSNRKDVARKYITYRNLRNEEREKDSELMHFVSDVIDLSNLENENANMPEWVFTAKNVRMSSEIAERYALNHLLDKRVKDAFQSHEIYIHDFDSYAVGSHNCLTIDLLDILERGFQTNNGDVRPPGSIRSAMQLTAVILQCQSNMMFGGISISSLDHDLAPYVDKSFKKHFKKGLKYISEKSEEEISKIFRQYKVGLEEKDIMGEFKGAYKYAFNMTKDETYQAAEALIHNLNTLQSRAGDQLPFTSVNFGTDTSIEGRMVSKSFLASTMRGIGARGLTPIFPISIFKHKKGVNAEEGDPNYDIKKMAIECSAKRIYPNFANADNPNLPTPTNKLDEFCTMGCRTAMGVDRHGVEGYSGRGNISPVTINLPKIGIDNGIALGKRQKPDFDGFWEQLDKAIDIAIKALVDRFEWQGKQLAKSAPFMYENELMKHNRKLEPNEPVREVLKHGTLVAGYLGLSNMLVAMIGTHHGESEEALELGLSVTKHINERMKLASEEYDLNFAGYATPAEGLSRKMLEYTRDEYGVIEGVTDREYINNSHHIPVYFPISAKEKIDIESKFAPYATGGNITYVELDGNARQNLEAIEDIVDYAMDKGVPYMALNHPIDACMKCGYEGIIGEYCPSCGGKDGDVYIRRLRRVTGYITSSYKEFFNKGKKAEVEDRVKHMSGTSDYDEL